MQSTFSALTHGSSGLLFGYLSVAIPMLAGLLRRHAHASKLLSVPLLAVPATLIASIAAAVASLPLRALGPTQRKRAGLRTAAAQLLRTRAQ